MKNKKKKIPHRKKLPQTRLNVLWFQRKKDINVKGLIDIVKTVDYLPIKKRAVIEFLMRENLNFNDFYDMHQVAKDVLEKYKDLKNKFWQQWLDLCNPDHLVELTEDGEKEAAKEFLHRIKIKAISKRKAKQGLIRFFEITRDEKTRKEILKEIKDLDPNEQELKYLIDLPNMYALPGILWQIRRCLKQRRRSNKVLEKIKKLIEEIKKGQV